MPKPWFGLRVCTRVLPEARRTVGVTAEGFGALQRQIEALQEQMRRGMNLAVRDESEDEREERKSN